MYQSPRFRNISILLLIAAAGIFSFWQMRPGQGWGDDFAMYIHHAKNIAEGLPYTETGYLFNNLAPTYAPENYPPGFPLILAPVIAVWGVNFTAMHIVLILSFMWMLWLVYLLLKARLKFSYLFIMLACIAFSPGYWGATDDVVADLPATCFALLFFYMLDKRQQLKPILFIACCGIVAYASYACRAPGMLLLPAALAAWILQNKKLDRQLFAALFVFIFFAALQALLINSEKGYLYMLQHGYTGKENLVNYFAGVANSYLLAFRDTTFYGGGLHTNLNQLFGSFLFVLFVAGFYLKCRSACGSWEIFFLFYLLLLVIFPGYQGFRYLMPVLPFYLFYVFSTLQIIHRKVALVFLVLFLTATVSMYYNFYRTIPEQWAQYRMDQPETWEAFDFMKTNLPPGAVVMATKPRAVSLFTDHPAAVYPDAKFEGDYYQNQDDLNVQFIFTSYIDKFQYPKLKAEADSIRFERIFTNSKFSVFKVNRDL